MLVINRSLDSSIKKSDQIFLMSTEGPNYKVIPLSKEFSEQSVAIIGTKYKQKDSTDIVILLVLIQNNNLVTFEI
jgi:hypothetical protein